jgi:FkbM family methyltransferase
MKYSQNNEEEIIGRYFGQFVGNLLSIGENNGQQLSNVYALIRNGWGGDLVEPSPQVFPELYQLHRGNAKIFCHDVAIGDKNGWVTLYDSGELLKQGDKALVSTVSYQETTRWRPSSIPFSEVQVKMTTFQMFMLERAGYQQYDFISIDAEGMDLTILRQMDLDVLECRCLCVEHNSLPAVVANIRECCFPFGFKEIGYNQENIILAR